MLYDTEESNRINTAIFYSITSTQKGIGNSFLTYSEILLKHHKSYLNLTYSFISGSYGIVEVKFKKWQEAKIG
jgi:hypothetical protein